MTETARPSLLILYDYFYPAYKAGGPIQSLTNLVLLLQDKYKISVITGSCDLNDDKLLPNIETNVWSDLLLPESAAAIRVWYAGSTGLTAATIKKLIKQVNPSVIYLNGMFSYRFVILPLVSIKKRKIIICPRGMLQKGALAGKSFKKKIYLGLLKISGLVNRVVWHATNEDERDDISREFGRHTEIIVAGNIPRKPILNISIPEKEPGKLQLVYLSLISEKKNLLQLIHVISMLKENVSLDIYGPVKDEGYFKKCVEAIKNSSGKVSYKGDVLPEKVQEIFCRYHASILLTKGENFGHALYESLSSGRPVITSNFTPWNQLEDKKAGWNVDIAGDAGITGIINEVCNLDQSAYNIFCEGAHRLANEYYQNGFNIANYEKIFS